jgi:hypothetical protein
MVIGRALRYTQDTETTALNTNFGKIVNIDHDNAGNVRKALYQFFGIFLVLLT